MKDEITVLQIQEILDTFNTAKEAEKGFILFPDIKGFAVYEIDKERLESYLKIEALYKQTQQL